LNKNLYPAGAEWQGDMLYLMFTRSGTQWATEDNEQVFGDALTLQSARWSATLSPTGVLAVELSWTSLTKGQGDYKVFVHLMTDDGRLIAQHDSQPNSGLRPTSTWQAGEIITDHHGLFMPKDGLPSGTRLHLLVGIYDAQTGQRLRTASGQDAAELGVITIQ
jgi:hypothetical protein